TTLADASLLWSGGAQHITGKRRDRLLCDRFARAEPLGARVSVEHPRVVRPSPLPGRMMDNQELGEIDAEQHAALGGRPYCPGRFDAGRAESELRTRGRH